MMIVRALAVVLALLPAAAGPIGEAQGKQEARVAADNDWPGWRGPRGDGSAAEGQKPPVTWSAEENIVWKAPVLGRGHGSACVYGEHVYLAACDEASGAQS